MSTSLLARHTVSSLERAFVFRVGLRVLVGLTALSAVSLPGCGLVGEPEEPEEPEWPPLAKKWFDRASESFRHADIEDAEEAVKNALRLVPDRDEVKILAANVALAKLEYARTIEVLKGVEGAEAKQIRGRAYWYSGKIDKAADELESLLEDPNVRDDWAKEVAKLARRGQGRNPFQVKGLLGYGEMPRVAASNPSLIIPLEINGEPALGMVHTGYAETVVDGSGEPTWISLRFGTEVRPGASTLEVKDVPALTKDLSGLSRGLNAPIKVLLGVNLLRHLHPTFDLLGGQFVVRSFEAPPPPAATTVRVNYLRGGGMVVRAPMGPGEDAPVAALLVDTSMTYPLALSDPGWEKAGVDLEDLQDVPNMPKMRQGTVPFLQMGAFQFPDVGAVHLEQEEELEIELDGSIGSGLLSAFRVTWFDGGRGMWLEDQPMSGRAGPPPPPPGAGAPGPGPGPAPKGAQPPAPKGPASPAKPLPPKPPASK